jgi:hypothetical protein
VLSVFFQHVLSVPFLLVLSVPFQRVPSVPFKRVLSVPFQFPTTAVCTWHVNRSTHLVTLIVALLSKFTLSQHYQVIWSYMRHYFVFLSVLLLFLNFFSLPFSVFAFLSLKISYYEPHSFVSNATEFISCIMFFHVMCHLLSNISRTVQVNVFFVVHFFSAFL